MSNTNKPIPSTNPSNLNPEKEIEKLKKDRDEANAALEKSQVLVDNLNKLIDQFIDRVRDQCETIDLSTANIVSIRRELQVMKVQGQNNPELLKQYLSQVEAQKGNQNKG